MPWLAAAAGIGGLVSGVGGYLSSREQSNAANAASQAQIAAANAAAQRQRQAGYEARGILSQGLPYQIASLNEAQRAGRADLLAGSRWSQTSLDNALAAARGGIARARGDISSGINSALGSLGAARGDFAGGQAGLEAALGQYGAQAAGSLAGGQMGAEQALARLQALQGFTGGATNAIGVAGGPGQMLNAVAAQDPFAGFEADPGYQFRQRQGEQAINRAASASGGRLSGRTLKELGRFNQGLASQEYQNFANRGLAARGQNIQIANTAQQSLENLAGRQLQAGLAAQQNQAQLAGLGYGAQQQIAAGRSGLGQQLAGLEMSQGQQIAAGRSGLGQQLAGLGQQAAGYQAAGGQQLAALQNQLASLGYQTETTRAGIQQNLAQNLAQQSYGTGSSIAQLRAANDAAQANALMQGAGAAGQITSASLPAYQAAVPYAGQGTAAIANAANSTLSNLMLLGASGMLGGGGGQQWKGVPYL